MRCNKLVYLSVYPIPCMRELLKRYEDKALEIFAPCTVSRFFTKDHISGMMNAGLEVIYCDENVSFEDTEIFFAPIMEHTHATVSLIPDVISNGGMARILTYFMKRSVQMTDDALFNDTPQRIRNAITNTFYNNSSKQNISKTAF